MVLSVAYANPFSDVKEKHETSSTFYDDLENIYLEPIENIYLEPSNPFKTALEDNEEIEDIKSSVNSIDSTKVKIVVITLVSRGIIAVGRAAVITLIICAIKAKKAGGFANAVKESFFKVFLITLVIVIALLILF
jgi:hypothetical protein